MFLNPLFALSLNNLYSGMMILIETDHNAYTEDTKSQRKIQMAEEMREAAGEDEQVILPSYLFLAILLIGSTSCH